MAMALLAFRHAPLVIGTLGAGTAAMALVEVVRFPARDTGNLTMAVPRLSTPPEMPKGFDVVRVERNGATLVAGRAHPHGRVEILIDGRAAETVIADETGSFVAMPSDLHAGAYEIALAISGPDGTREILPGRVAVVVPASEGIPLVAHSEPGHPTEILSGPEDERPLAASAAAAEGGRLLVSGRAPPGRDVTLNLDGIPLAKGRSDASGRVTFDLPAPVGDARRIRLTSSDPATRLSLESEEATFGAPSPVPVGGQVRIRVAAGQTLWQISRSAYSRGERYTVIFTANKGTLHSPHRIYPGQALVIPNP